MRERGRAESTDEASAPPEAGVPSKGASNAEGRIKRVVRARGKARVEWRLAAEPRIYER
jgi:hypothetical protein